MQKLLFLSMLAAVPLLAVGPCPTGAFTDGTYQGAGGGCNTLITFNLDGSITTTVPNANPYDGVEDTLVGIVNNSNSVITTVFLSGVSDLFGFDGDGICNGWGLSAADCPHGSNTTNGNDYLAQALSFSNISPALDSGNVNFTGIAANGGTAFFSLEEAPSLSLQVNTPEPTSVILLGSCLGIYALAARRRRRNA